MSKLYKVILALCFAGSLPFAASAQQDRYWSSTDVSSVAVKNKTVARQSFPKTFLVYNLNMDLLKQQLFTVTGRPGHTTVITLPGADGQIEQFRVVEASNFVPELQARFPEIRAFSGQGITDPAATLKLSYSPQGVQTMVFRNNGGATEYLEPYSADGRTVAVFKSQRTKGGLPWVCSTPDADMARGLNNHVYSNRIESSAGQLKTMRLAQSVVAEYSNFFGATSSAQVALVLAAVNATMTRTNGCYEKDLGLHLNLIANTTDVFYYDPATDPYSPGPVGAGGAWNGQLQSTLTSVIGEANYDVGHLFGQSGGGGNAGCIGCVCVNNQKGRGFTSPADGIPQGDNFDIDYVAHEIGHQLGGNHTFSMGNEGSGVNKEVGSGITIMGYAGITSQDVAPHSIDIFHEASIQQIQVNLAGKTCPVTTPLAGINATPVVAAVSNYTVPISTPFALTGSATDADPGDVLTYCWEQNDDGAGQTGNNSVARENKPTGPNWLSWPATTSPTRLMPRLSTILAGLNITPCLPGGDAVANTEALSNVNRTLNFRLTVRDNRPYNGTAVGQTQFTDMVVTVDNTGGPFLITSQNSAVSYPQGTSQTVTWSVGSTTGAPFNSPNVRITMSDDGGLTFPHVLAASTPNDGSESIVIPSVLTSTGRIRVESIGNIFFDINNANVTITVPPNGFTFNSPAAVTATCPAPNVMTSGNLTATYLGTFTGNINLTGTVAPAGPTVSFSNATLTQASNSTTVSLTGMATLSPGNYVVTVTGVGVGGPTVTQNITFTINPGAGPVINTQPASQTLCVGGNATFTASAASGTYQWQVSTPAVPAFTNIPGATSATLNVNAVTAAMNGNQYRVVVTGQCGSTNSDAATLTVNVAPVVTTQPTSQSVCSGSAISFTAAASGTPAATIQWQISTAAVPAFTNIPGATSGTYTIASTTLAMNGDQFRAVFTNSCGTVNSNAATLTVNSSVTVTGNPASVTICEGTNTSFTVAASGTGLLYQWEVSTNGGGSWANVTNGGVYGGATTPTLTITGATPSMNNYQYRAVVSSPPCAAGVSTAATLTINTFPVVTTQPQSATICEGANVNFSVTATTGVGVLSYQWQVSTNGGGSYSNITGATSSTLALTQVTAGANSYRYRVVVTAGCGSVTSNGAILTVDTYPSITLGSVPAVACVSDPAFALTGSPAGGAFSGQGVSGGTFNPSVAGIGAATVTYTATNAGCTATESRIIQVNECADRHLRLNEYPAVIVYPNPSSGMVSVRINTDLYNEVDVRVFNSQGGQVYSKSFAGIGYGSILDLNLSGQASGTYHIYMVNKSSKDSRGTSIVIYK